jgi:hypothetical protein
VKNDKVPFHTEEEKRMYINHIMNTRKESQIHVLEDTIDKTNGLLGVITFPIAISINGIRYAAQKISNAREKKYLNNTPVVEEEEVKNSKINMIKSLVKEMYTILNGDEYYYFPYYLEGVIDVISILDNQEKYNKYVDELYDICQAIIRATKLSKRRRNEGLSYIDVRVRRIYIYSNYSVVTSMKK